MTTEALHQPAKAVEALPQYAKIVIRECREVELRSLQRASFPLPDRFTPVVICVIKDEADRLDDFLRHYRNHGVERFVFIDNGSTDRSLEMLSRQPDVDLFLRLGRFNWMLKQGWINRVVELYGHDRWYIYADADEHIVFDSSDYHSFADLTWHMEVRGLCRVRGFLIDMYGAAPLVESTYTPGQPLIDAYPWFDRDTYTEERYIERIGVKGGPRMRVFGGDGGRLRPELTKYPLFKLRRGDYMTNPHHIWPYEENFRSERFLGILHYKFLPDLAERASIACVLKNYWNQSIEYECYRKALQADPKLTMLYPGSERFESVDQLVSLGLIAPVGWADPTSPSDAARAAFRRRRQQNLGRCWSGNFTSPASVPAA